jgi:lipopolysaccharide transport system permease protein
MNEVDEPEPGSARAVTLHASVIESQSGWRRDDLRELWDYRELLFFLVWRDLKVRYKQTLLGAGWAILQPALGAALFALVFGVFAKLPSDGVPYLLFAYLGLLPWQLFAFALNESTQSVVQHQQLVKKVYFPRLFLPLTPIVGAVVDFGVASVVLVAMMVFFGVSPGARVLALPLLVLAVVTTALAVSIWLTALNVKYRDVRYAMPFLVQVWFFATPVVYSSTLIPAHLRPFWALNPMATVVDGFRWAVLGAPPPPAVAVGVACLVVAVLLLGGLRYFRSAEATFADVV